MDQDFKQILELYTYLYVERKSIACHQLRNMSNSYTERKAIAH